METPNRNWNQRWAELRPHPEQLRLWNDQIRFKLVTAGRRSGKTELAKRRLAEHVFRRTAHGQHGNYFAAAPTRDQAKRIWWNDLKALIPRKWRKVSESELWIKTKHATLWVIGLDKAERMEGTPWDGGAIDELASCKAGLWDANIRPALSTPGRQGWCWLIGVPDWSGPAQADYLRLHAMALKGEPDWSVYHWPSADILDPAEIESARRQMDARLFEQEYLGHFVIPGGRAFPDFDRAIHASKQIEYDPALPLCWTLDFNINPMCSGVIQHHKGEVRVIDELVLRDTRTEDAVREFQKRASDRGWNLDGLKVYGDATGNARDSTSGISDWFIVRNMLPSASLRVPSRNPNIADTVNAVNGRIKTASGEVNLRVDPSCKQLIADMESAAAKTDMEEQHCVAWLRYFCQSEYPVMFNATTPMQIVLG